MSAYTDYDPYQRDEKMDDLRDEFRVYRHTPRRCDTCRTWDGHDGNCPEAPDVTVCAYCGEVTSHPIERDSFYYCSDRCHEADTTQDDEDCDDE